MEVVDFENFVGQMGLAMQGKLNSDQEYELQDLAAHLMGEEEVDEELKEFFKSSFLILSKKQKRFLDIRKLNRLKRKEAGHL